VKRINLRLSVEDVENLISRLDDILESISPGEITDRLAEEGASAAEAAYGFPVSTERTDDNATSIIATHDGLSFLEFGAGLATNESHPDASEVPYPVRRGSYSDQHNGMYRQTGYEYWIFGGRPYVMIVPRGGMLAAGMAIRDNMTDILKEVTGLD
jgi:hypothetical protein